VNWENARVLFHEMGHALHALLAQAPYYLLGMQFVAWDIIELPSQIFEHLLTSPELLSRFARHHKTGEPMPDRMIRYLQNNASFDPGAWSLHVGAPAIIDLRLHQSTMEDDIGPASIEAEALAEIPMPRTIDPRHSVANFSHIFAERYAAGYYCYHWADMMVADTLEIFLASPGGFLDRATARRFEQKLLSIAHAVPAREAYRDFAGHDPQIGTLMRKLCLAG
jgi:peptidyl-dipeptidase Dcp